MFPPTWTLCFAATAKQVKTFEHLTRKTKTHSECVLQIMLLVV